MKFDRVVRVLLLNAALLGILSSTLTHAQEQWEVEPEITIGTADGAEEYVLPNIIYGTVLHDGTIVVALFLRSYFELRYYDSEGEYLTSAGRFGQGPFEVGGRGFSAAERMRGDSILVIDRANRFHVFGPRGEKIRSGRFPYSGNHYFSHLVDPDHLAIEEFRHGETPMEDRRITLLLLNWKTGESDSLATFPYLEGESDGRLFFEYPFGTFPRIAAGSGRVWFGFTGEGTIRSVDPNGISSSTIEFTEPRVAVTRAHQRDYKRIDADLWGRVLEDDRIADVERHHRRMEFPDSFPFYQDLKTDSEGNVWVLRYQPRWSEDPFVWDVFDSGGQHIARVDFPFGWMSRCIREVPIGGCTYGGILDIGEDWVLTAHRDEWDVQRLRVFRLKKPS